MHYQNVQDTDVISNNITFMKEYAGEALTLWKLAEQSSLSVARHSKLFTQKTVFSPVDHFIQLKIQYAGPWLGYIPILWERGSSYGSLSGRSYYFSRIFEKPMQMSPIEFRKEIGKKLILQASK